MNQNHHLPSPDCVASAPLLPLAAHGLLSQRQASALQGHLATCAECRTELATYDQAEDALRRTFAHPPGTLPPFSREEIREMLSSPAQCVASSSLSVVRVERPWPNRQRGNSLAFAAALVLVLLAVGIFNFPGLFPRSTGNVASTPVSNTLLPVDLSHYVLNSISMVSTDEGWAVGATLLPQHTTVTHSVLEYIYGAPVILHYSQSHWKPVPLPFHCQAGCHIVLHSIAMVSATEGWAVGNSVLPPNADGVTSGFILHYSGGKWSRDSQRGSTLSRVAMNSANDGWIIGSGVYHYQGNTWSWVNDPTFSQINPQSIAALSPTNVWLTGTDISDPGFDGDAPEVILHYDGHQWRRERTDLANSRLSGIAMISPTEGWAAGCLAGGYGEHPTHLEKALVEQYTQGRWQQNASIAGPLGKSSCLYGIATFANGEGWAVGSDGLIVHETHGVWARIASPTSQTFYSIAMISPSEGWAVGDQGTILHYVHDSWSKYQS